MTEEINYLSKSKEDVFQRKLTGIKENEMTLQIKKNQEKEKNNNTVVIIACILLLVIAVVIAVIVLRSRPEEDADAGSENRGTIVTQDNAESLIVEEGAVEDGYYDVFMSIDWHFKDGVTEDAKIANKTTNTRTVYFDLLTEETEELVYSSPYIPVGESMQGFTLDKDMDPGTYDMIVRYYLVDDNNMEVSNVSVGITVYVE